MGTHPIFESDFDCLTEWHGRFLHSDSHITQSLVEENAEFSTTRSSVKNPSTSLTAPSTPNFGQRRSVSNFSNCLASNRAPLRTRSDKLHYRMKTHFCSILLGLRIRLPNRTRFCLGWNLPLKKMSETFFEILLNLKSS